MFEGKPLEPGRAKPLDSGDGEAEALREISWDTLVSRLVAARDLRAELGRADHCPASFHDRSARRMAALRDGEHSINPDDLGNRKGDCSREGSAADQSINGARGSR